MKNRRPAGGGCGCALLGALLLIVAVVIAVVLGQSQIAAPTLSPTPPPADTAAPIATATSPSIPYQLAVIQAGHALPPDDPLVHDFAAALAHLAPTCQETEHQLSNLTVSTHDLLLRRGVDETYLSILRHIDAGIPPAYTRKIGREKCVVDFALYVHLRAPH